MELQAYITKMKWQVCITDMELQACVIKRCHYRHVLPSRKYRHVLSQMRWNYRHGLPKDVIIGMYNWVRNTDMYYHKRDGITGMYLLPMKWNYRHVLSATKWNYRYVLLPRNGTTGMSYENGITGMYYHPQDGFTSMYSYQNFELQACISERWNCRHIFPPTRCN